MNKCASINSAYAHLGAELITPAAHDFRSALNAALVALALRDPDPVERAAKLAILRKDGWL